MMALLTRFSRQGVPRAPRATKWEGTPHPLTLTETRAAVKKSRGPCCATANGPSITRTSLFCLYTVCTLTAEGPVIAVPTIILGRNSDDVVTIRSSPSRLGPKKPPRRQIDQKDRIA